MKHNLPLLSLITTILISVTFIPPSSFITAFSSRSLTAKIYRKDNILSMSMQQQQRSCEEKTCKIFAGKTVLLTGASGGLGRCFALQLAHSSVHTLVLSGRNEDALKSVEEECKNLHSDIIIHRITCDLSDRDSVSELTDKALTLCNQRIDILINNGGVSSRSKFLDTTAEVDQKVMQINFFAGAAIAKGVVPGMVERGYGKIIWISSVQGLLGIPNRTSYASSKFAVQGYCESLRSELASSGVTVHVASPGYIRTNLSRSALMGDGGLYAKMDSTTAAGADPNDTAIDIMEKVAADKADFTTATTFSAKAAIWLKFFAPSILRAQLVKRFEKSKQQEK